MTIAENSENASPSGGKKEPGWLLVADEVDRLRRQHRPRPVDLDRAPHWWRARINVLFARHELSAWREVTYRLAYDPAGGRVLDHFGRSTSAEGTEVFASEPFADYPKPWLHQAVASVAGAMGLHYQILDAGQSWHFPGRTARIEFWECWHMPQCDGCLTRIDLRERCRAQRRAGRRR